MKGRPPFLRERPASSACEYLPPRLCVGGAGVVGVLSQREAYVTLSFSLSIWFMDLKTQRAVRVSQGQCRDREGTQRGYLGARRVPPPLPAVLRPLQPQAPHWDGGVASWEGPRGGGPSRCHWRLVKTHYGTGELGTGGTGGAGGRGLCPHDWPTQAQAELSHFQVASRAQWPMGWAHGTCREGDTHNQRQGPRAGPGRDWPSPSARPIPKPSVAQTEGRGLRCAPRFAG